MNKKILFVCTLFLIIFLFIWDKFLYQQYIALNSNFRYSVDLISLDNFYNSDLKLYEGETNSVARFSYNVIEEKKDILLINNSFDVKTIYGEPIVSIDRLYGINKLTQKHEDGSGDKNRSGYLFAPKNLDKKESFIYWHVNYDGPAMMSFVKEEEINGLTVYLYESDYSEVTIDQTESLTHLPGVPEEKGVMLQPHLKIWVEPVSGWLVHYADQTDATFYDIQTNQIIEPWNSFRNFYTQSSIDKQVSIAKNLKYEAIFIHYGMMILVTLMWFLIFIIFNFNKKFKSSFLIKSLIFGLLFFLTILSTLGAWWYTGLQSEEFYSMSLDRAKQDVQQKIVERMNVYANALSGTRGLFYSSDEVTRSEWKSYFDTISVSSKYPGLQGFGYAKIIEENEISSLEQQIRSEGFPEFTFYPLGEREIYSSVIYIEPFDERNKRAFGFDMFSESTRKHALDVAAKTGQLSLSGKVTLVQEFDTGVQPGTLMYIPHYQDEKLEGYIFSIFRMYDLIGNMFSLEDFSELGFRIYDARKSDKIGEENLLFDSQVLREKSEEVIFLGQYPLYLYNNKWIIEYFAPVNSPLYSYDTEVSDLIFSFGVIILIVLLIFFIFLIVSQYKNRLVLAGVKQQSDVEKNLMNKKNKFLTSQLKKFNLAQKISNIGYFEYDLVSEKAYWSDQQFEIHNISKTALPIKLNNYIDIVVPEYKKRFEKKLYKLMNSKKIYSFTYPITTESKDNKWLKLSGLAVYENNQVVKVIGTVQDVNQSEGLENSHRKLISYVIKQLQIPLKEKKSLINTLFLSGVNNLNNSQIKIVKNIESIIDNMFVKTKFLANMINMEHGVYNFSVKLFNPKDVLKLVLSKFEKELKNKELKLSVQIDENISPFVSDVSLVGDVLSIVLSNAINYSPHLSEIKIDVTEDINNLIFMITDHGYGIPEKEKINIFKRYYRGSNVLKYNKLGTGLSLSYAKKVIELLGGSIDINSLQDKGTTVVIKLTKKAN